MSQPGPLQKVTRAEELNAVGAQLFGQGNLEPARLHFLAALSLEPENPRALQNLGACLRNLKHYAAAEVVAARSVKVTKGENAFCRSNLGVSKFGLRKYDESLSLLEGVVADLPDSGPSWHNLGLNYYMLGRYKEAFEAFDKGILLHDNKENASDRALALLSMGRIQEGLEAYEVRWKLLHQNRIWQFGIPEWQGECLDGCRILLHHEQGFGDSIMLVRFIKGLAKYKCQITLAVPESLRLLFQRSFPFISVLDLDDEEKLNNTMIFDYHSPLLSLMRWIGVEKAEDISSEPYLRARPLSVMKLPDARVKIGICWASGNHSPHLEERRRVVPISLFLPLLEDTDVALISLQKGEDVKDLIANGLEGLVFDISPKLEDFAATADTMMYLDLIITVDSAVAHLAGAIGKPCLMLSPYTRCWRWWSKQTGWPWYNRMKLFHQAQDGSWDRVMREVIANAKWIVK